MSTLRVYLRIKKIKTEKYLWLPASRVRTHSNPESLRTCPRAGFLFWSGLRFGVFLFSSNMRLREQTADSSLGKCSPTSAVCSHPPNTVTVLKRDKDREIIRSFPKCPPVPENFLSRAVWYECAIAITVTDNCQLWIFSRLYSSGFCLLLHQCTNLKQISKGAVSSYLWHEKIYLYTSVRPWNTPGGLPS